MPLPYYYQVSQKYPQKRAFITGAASGLGRALALELARDQWYLGLADINWSPLKETARLVESKGSKALPYALDVSNRSQYAEVAKDFLGHTQGIDLLFNNAGVGDGGRVSEYSLENWDWIVGINQMGVLYGCHYFIPTMREQGAGHIINTASAAAFANAPRMAPYNMTKAAVLSLSETLHTELDEFNIKVSCVMPSYFKTNIIQYARGGEEVKSMGQKMIDDSKLGASEVAQTIMAQVGRAKLHILIAKEAHLMWWVKRISPSYFFKSVKKRIKKVEIMVEQLRGQTREVHSGEKI